MFLFFNLFLSAPASIMAGTPMPHCTSARCKYKILFLPTDI